jgi:hypothetical protein
MGLAKWESEQCRRGDRRMWDGNSDIAQPENVSATRSADQHDRERDLANYQRGSGIALAWAGGAARQAPEARRRDGLPLN